MLTLYGISLELSGGGRGYLSTKREWTATPEDPLVFGKEEDAEKEALSMMVRDTDYFLRIGVIKLFPGVNQWFVG